MKIIVRWRPLALVGLALLGLLLRLYGLNWDQGNNFHPDEREILFHVTALAWPHSIAQFFDAANSPLNPHFFAYGSLPLYLLAGLGNLLARFFPALGSFTNLTLVGRVLSALFDSGTILLTGWLGLLLVEDTSPGRRNAWSVALLAAAFVTFTPFQLQLSHFYAVDTMLLFFVVLTVLACVALVKTDAPIRWAVVAGLGFGLALATKFSAAPLIVPLAVALCLRWFQRGFLSALAPLLVALVVTLLSFLITMPYALLDSQNFVQQVSDQGNLARGLLDLPYVRQFAGTVPFVYEVQNMVLWGMGVTLGLAAFAGLLWLCWRVWRHHTDSWLVVLAWVLVYGGISGSFYVKFMRYMLPVYPFLALMAAALLLAIAGRLAGLASRESRTRTRRRLLLFLRFALPLIVLGGTIFQGLALLNVYSLPNTRVQASRWIYSHIKLGSTLTYEQWDDPLPVAVDGHDPSVYRQLTYADANGQPQTGLDLYGDDTMDKARLLANLLPTVDAITMPTDRLDKSIPRLPLRYPLTIHYYQLLESGQLGFHLAAKFENHPNLFGITLDDSGADESYSVFDHPTAKIYVRDDPYPYTADQLLQKLLSGVQLPAAGVGLSGIQRSLLLTPQQIADDQNSPPFSVQFPSDSPSNSAPVFFWWLVLLLLGLLMFPLTFSAFRALRDRGYIFSKLLGILLLAYVAWLLASLHLLPFDRLSLLLIVSLIVVDSVLVYFRWRVDVGAYLRQHWRLLLFEEEIFTLVFLLFVGIRALNPDLWQIYFGGEKPMELAFLNAVLRSPYMPPYDPWFAGGYINYYYYGYVIIGALIKLTGIIPTTAFNLAIPTLFAFTFTGAFAIIYTLTRKLPIALLGGYFAAMIGNLDGLEQLKGQIVALLARLPLPPFNYWQSSRVIPFTINEFPFWSFLFADLHPHVIDLPIAMTMIGILVALIHSGQKEEGAASTDPRRGRFVLYMLAAFVFGTIACVNPWDLPVYALLLAAGLLIQKGLEKRGAPRREWWLSLAFQVVIVGFLCALGYLFYLPFYVYYQQLYINGIGMVKTGSGLGDYLTVFGFWIFLALSFIVFELYHWWQRFRAARGKVSVESRYEVRRIMGYLLLCSVVLIFLALLGIKALLVVLLALGVFLFVAWQRELFQMKSSLALRQGAYATAPAAGEREEAGGTAPARGLSPLASPRVSSPLTERLVTSVSSDYVTYLLVLMGLGLCLGIEVVYVRDFLDGGDYARMNTVFKFSMQAWLCLAIGGTLIVWRLWQLLSGVLRQVWSVLLVVLIVGCSVFLFEGTSSRLLDHQVWVQAQAPVQGANYLPTLDGFAFVHAWYPGDAAAITWLNDHVSGSPVILEAAAPASYQWFNRVSVFTGLPDVLGWPDHVGEQRYSSQPLNRMADIGIIYSTTDTAQAIELLRYYHVRYVYVGALEQQTYAQQTSAGLDKFNHMPDTLRVDYRFDGVTIYEVM